MIKFNNLHFYSEYSFLESPTKIKDYVEYGKKNKLTSLVLTDHNNIHGYGEFRKYCNLYSIKPIFGIDLDFQEGRLILLAKDNKGFDYIKLLAFKKSKNENLSINNLNTDNIYVINNPNYGIKKNDFNKLKNFYFFSNEDKNESNIYVKDTRILDQKHFEALEIINKLKDINLDKNNDYTFLNNFQINEIYLQNINNIINTCNVYFENKKNMLPSFSDDPTKLLEDIINEEIKNKTELKKYDDKTVKERIAYELEVIKKMKVENYFLIIYDLIKWSKNNNIFIGPGRGSVSGSLISFILGITLINPLEFNLYFERFLNEERVSMPDIDIDIQDDKRDDVINYLKEKYGHENVSQICTFQRIGAKLALKDCARFLNISFSKINEITKLISNTESLKESYEKNVKFKSVIDSEEELEKLFKYAVLVENLPRQVGVHAAGIIISKDKIINSIPILEIDNNIVTQLSMEFIEDWNLLKIDLLGLRTLTIIKKIENEIKKNYNKNFDFNSIPLNDEKTNKLLSSSKVLGIFQLESPGMINTLKKVNINNFNDLVDTISLFRPGPLSNIPIYIANKNNKNLIPKISKEYDSIVEKTNGIIIYQEQIMEIIQKVAGLSFSKSDILRRAISKKNKEDILNMEKLFINGAIKNNINENIAQKIFNEIIKFAEYGFNKSHAVAYATLSYRMAYLKAKFPLCFYIGIISISNSIDTINKCVIEARELKFNIESPLINKISFDIVHDNKNTIYLPLTFIKGLGSVANNKIVNEFLNNGKFKDFFDFIARCKKNNIGESIIDILINSNTLREFGNMETLRNNKLKALSYASAISYLNKDTNEIVLDQDAKKPNLEIFQQNLANESKNEIKYLGMVYNAFATSKYETNDKLNNLKVGIEYKIVLLIKSKKQIVNKYNKFSYFVEVCDSTKQETIWFTEKNLEIFNELEINTIGYAEIIKLDRNGKIYFNLKKWTKIK